MTFAHTLRLQDRFRGAGTGWQKDHLVGVFLDSNIGARPFLDEHQFIPGVLKIPLNKHFLRGCKAWAVSDLNTGGHLAAARCIGSRRSNGLIEQILKISPTALKSGAIDVGQIVGDDIDIRCLGPQA